MRFNRVISTLMMVFIVVAAFAENNYKVTSSSPLNIREAASSSANILGTFNSGSQIEVLSIKKGWAKVKYNGGFGFVQAQYIEQFVPQNNSDIVGQTNIVFSETQSTKSKNSEMFELSDFESERKTGVYEITYAAGSFEDVKLSGTYGFSWTMLPWEIAPKLYAGIHFSPLNFNYGLSDFNYDEIRLGPAIGYYFTPKILLSMPLDILCDVYFGENDETKTAWGMALAPAVYIGSKAGIFIGPQFTVAFSGNSKVSCGFRAGVYF
ncbi:MAG: SH3 domain-containing protein [Muribaculaceae bacterium]|nr:SH3 domain-containing protein [Muribaculaceae bacterium]